MEQFSTTHDLMYQYAAAQWLKNTELVIFSKTSPPYLTSHPERSCLNGAETFFLPKIHAALMQKLLPHFPFFSRIMMLSVLRHTKTPVKFWFLKNYLSPSFKVLLSLQGSSQTFWFRLADLLQLLEQFYFFAAFQFTDLIWPTWLSLHVAEVLCFEGFFASENRIFRQVLSSVYLNKCRNRLTVAFGCCFLSKVPAGANEREQSGTCQQLLVTMFLITVRQHKLDCSNQFLESVTFFFWNDNFFM